MAAGNVGIYIPGDLLERIRKLNLELKGKDRIIVSRVCQRALAEAFDEAATKMTTPTTKPQRKRGK